MMPFVPNYQVAVTYAGDADQPLVDELVDGLGAVVVRESGPRLRVAVPINAPDPSAALNAVWAEVRRALGDDPVRVEVAPLTE